MSSERPSLFAELRRRNVYRVALVYAGVAWGLLQLADLAFPRLGLPDWTITLVLAISAVGFPIAVVCAWAFDLTSEGLKRTPSPGSEDAQPTSPLRVVEFVVIAGLVAAVGYLYATRLTPGAASTPGRESAPPAAVKITGPEAKFALPAGPPSIAVLPFVNMSQDSDNQYFSDGISEELLDALAKLGRLHVAARTSSFSFRDSNEDIRTIGQQLGVGTLLEGSVRKSGNRVRITAQLINAANGFHLWSETYDRELTDIFAVQDEIARSIVAALRVPLGLSPEAALVDTGTSNVEAYNAYLRGLHYFKLIGPETYEKTIQYMKRAIALDPTFARPHGTLASAYSIAALWLPRQQAFPLAKASFERALELDPTLGIALLTKAQYVTLTEWDWLAARGYFTRALEDESATSIGAISYATLHLIPLGSLEEAHAILAEAEALDPVDPRIKIVKASLALFSGDVDGAISQYELTLDLDAENIQAAAALCSARVGRGDISGAVALLSDWEARLGFVHPWLMACRAYLELAQGRIEDAVQTYSQMSATASTRPGAAFFAGDVALRLGRIDEAIDWYEKSLEEGEIGIMMTRIRHARETELNAHPRYQALLARMRLDDASLAAFRTAPSASI